MNFNMSGISGFIKSAAKSAWAFGKKNSASFAAGGGMALSWLSLILMMVEAPKAAEAVKEEKQRREDEDLPKMTKVETALTYGSKCWPAFATEAVGTALEVYAHRDLLSSVSQLYMVSQMYKEDGEKLRKQILKEEGGEKKLEEYSRAAFHEEHPDEELMASEAYQNIQSGETLVKEETSDKEITMPIGKLRAGFDNFNSMMHDRWLTAYEKALKKALCGKLSTDFDQAFYSESDKPIGTKSKSIDEDYLRSVVYVTATFDEYLEYIGFKKPRSKETDLGRTYEFRYHGNGPCVDYNKVVDFEEFIDPKTGKVHYARIKSLLDEGLIFVNGDLPF